MQLKKAETIAQTDRTISHGGRTIPLNNQATTIAKKENEMGNANKTQSSNFSLGSKEISTRYWITHYNTQNDPRILKAFVKNDQVDNRNFVSNILRVGPTNPKDMITHNTIAYQRPQTAGARNHGRNQA